MLKRNTVVAMPSNPKPATPTPPKPKPPPEPLPPNPPPIPPKAALMTSAVYTNDYFVIEPCCNCPIAGYLIVRPIAPAFSLSKLPREALDSLGVTLAAASRAIETVIHPERIYCALFAEETRSVHFHLFPRTRWLLSRYEASHSVDRDVSGPQLFDWARRTFHPPASADYGQLNEAIFRELTPNV
jgi:diadenosine tetraphosphate (Ap4A) HIT family hydrolase